MRMEVSKISKSNGIQQTLRLPLVRPGLAAIHLKRQCDVFGLRDDLGWMEPDVSKWLREE